MRTQYKCRRCLAAVLAVLLLGLSVRGAGTRIYSDLPYMFSADSSAARQRLQDEDRGEQPRIRENRGSAVQAVDIRYPFLAVEFSDFAGTLFQTAAETADGRLLVKLPDRDNGHRGPPLSEC